MDARAERGHPAPAGRDGSDLVTCALRITTAPVDHSLARVVGIIHRTRWSVRELHHVGGGERNEIEVRASKVGGRADLLLALVRRDVVVIDACQAAPEP